MSKTKQGSNATFTGVQQGLTVIGNHCYAYNYYLTNNVARSELKFTTGKGYIRGTLQLNAGVDDDDASESTVQSIARVTFNGDNISLLSASVGATPDRRPSSNTQELIIPPNTSVDIIVDDASAEADKFGSISFTGEVYG